MGWTVKRVHGKDSLKTHNSVFLCVHPLLQTRNRAGMGKIHLV